MSAAAALAPDAAMVLGIASTAMPFARTPEAEAERWLRVLRLHGEAGAALQALGVSDAPLDEPLQENSGPGGARPGRPGDRDAVAQVAEQAARVADRRGASAVATIDVLVAVMHVYGEDFDRVLRAHGTDRDTVLGLLDA